MPMSPEQVRQQIATRIAALGSPWNQAPVAYDKFDVRAVPDAIPATKAKGSFSVGLQNETVRTPQRQKASEGVLVESDLGVRFFWPVKPKDQLASGDVALEEEQSLLAQLMAVDATWPANLKLIYQSATRSTPGAGEWHLVQLNFQLLYRRALQ